jgi:hypothetical protein
MNLHVHLRQPDQVAGWLRDAGFTVKTQMVLELDRSVPQAILIAHRRP